MIRSLKTNIGPQHRPKVEPISHISRRIQVRSKEVMPNEQEDVEEVIYEELKAVWIVFKLFGSLPLQKLKAGVYTFSWLSRQMLYASLFYATMSVMGGRVMLVLHLTWSSTPSLEIAVLIRRIVVVLFLVPHFLLAVTHWYQARLIGKMMNDWRAFQVEYRTVTRTSLRLKMRRVSTGVVVTCVTFICFGVAALAFLTPVRDVTRIVYSAYSALLSFVHLVLWCLLCSAVRRAAGELMKCFTQDFLTSRGGNALQIYEYKCLWLQLSLLTRYIGNVYFPAFGFLCTLWVGIILLCTYQALEWFSRIQGNDSSSLIIALMIATSVYCFCHYAGNATQAVGDAIKDGLVAFQARNNESREQLHLFDAAISLNQPTISLGGYVTIDKQLIVSIMSTIVTYMVVLLQFRGEDKSKVESSTELTI